jgi:hypothetical protein
MALSGILGIAYQCDQFHATTKALFTLIEAICFTCCFRGFVWSLMDPFLKNPAQLVISLFFCFTIKFWVLLLFNTPHIYEPSNFICVELGFDLLGLPSELFDLTDT